MYKMGGRINGTLRYSFIECDKKTSRTIPAAASRQQLVWHQREQFFFYDLNDIADDLWHSNWTETGMSQFNPCDQQWETRVTGEFPDIDSLRTYKSNYVMALSSSSYVSRVTAVREHLHVPPLCPACCIVLHSCTWNLAGKRKYCQNYSV